MADVGHERTNDIIDEMTKQIEQEYAKAAKAVEKKLNAYLKSFDQKEAEQLKLLDAGKITQQQLNTWRQTQMLTGKRWQDLLEQLTGDMVNANDIARSTIRGHMADVYTLNRNYAAYQVEKDAHIDTSWTLYNRRATENLFKNNDNLLPMPKPGGRAWQQMQNEDTRWNQQKINSSMIQGILQGDGIRELSGRLMRVVGMNENSAVRSARTMTTYVQNKARDDTFAELAEKGVEMDQQWVATLDDRTRSTHRWLHGEVRSEDGTYSNGLRFPGDPLGDPEEVYNCRCTEISHVKGFPLDIPRTSPKMTMDFDEWLGEKPERLVDVEDTLTTESVTRSLLDDLRTAVENHRTDHDLTSVPWDDRMKSNLSKPVSIEKLGAESANMLHTTLGNYLSTYDTMLSGIRTMNADEALSNAFAFVRTNYETGSAELVINPVKCKDVESLTKRIIELSKTGYCVHVPDDKAGEYVYTHEFAHTLFNLANPLSNSRNWVGEDYGKVRAVRKEISSVFEQYMKELQGLDKTAKSLEMEALLGSDQALWDRAREARQAFKDAQISKYSMENADEFFAECFTNETIGDTSNPYSRMVMEIINKHFKRG